MKAITTYLVKEALAGIEDRKINVSVKIDREWINGVVSIELEQLTLRIVAKAGTVKRTYIVPHDDLTGVHFN